MMRQSETMRAASRLLRSHPIVCLLAALAAVVVLGVLGPIKVVHAADVAVEGENFDRPASGTNVITGAGYSGGAAPFSVNGSDPQALTSTTTTAYTFHLPDGANTISVKAGGTGPGHNAFLDVAKFPADGGSVAMPSETPDQTPMVNGPVRAIEQVGTNIWVGGKFTQVKQRNGTVVANVSNNLAVFDSQTNQYKDIAALPKLGGTGAEVWDMTLYGENVLIAGKFSGPTSTQKNLVLVDGTTGKEIQWYNAPSLKSALAAPNLGRVYGGGVSLTAFDKDNGTPLWSQAKTTVNTTLYPDAPTPGYRDLELDGKTIWAACACDAVGGNPAKALVKLNTEGAPEALWRAAADSASWGMSVLKATDGPRPQRPVPDQKGHSRLLV